MMKGQRTEGHKDSMGEIGYKRQSKRKLGRESEKDREIAESPGG